MASDAKAILSHPRSTDLQLDAVRAWLWTEGPLVALAGIAFAYAAMFLSGLHLFDNDYDWINQATDTGWMAILGEILRPVPAQWGFQDRPVQVLVFKILHSLFGYAPAAYYTFKALLFAGITYGIARLTLTLGLNRPTALLAGGVFALASPGQASALWVSDFELLAEILIILSLAQFWRLTQRLDHSRIQEILHQTLFVLIVVAAHRTKGSAKLIPAICVVYLALYHRDQIRRFMPAMAAIALTIVPVFQLLENPVPPFVPFAKDQSQGWMWKPANLGTLTTLLVGNFHPIGGTNGPDIAFSILAVLTPAILWPVAAGTVFLCIRERKSFSERGLVLVSAWALTCIGAYASFPKLPEEFMARYVVVGLVPLSILSGWVLSTATARWTRRLAVPALAAVLMLHAGHNLDSTRHLRDTLGQLIVAYDKARTHIATQISESGILIIGFDYGYNKRATDSNRYHREKLSFNTVDDLRPFHVLVRTDQNIDAIEHRTPMQDIQKAVKLPAMGGGMRVKVRPIKTFAGLTDSFYDRNIYRSRQTFAGILYEVTYEQGNS